MLGRDSFCAAFEHLYDPADLNAFLADAYGEETIAREIADPVMIHAVTQDAPGAPLSGFCKLKYPARYESASDAVNVMVLGQLYTAPGRTGEGIGAALMEWALGEARTRDCDAVQLSVWSENFGAQRFYQRHGFRRIGDLHFWVGNHRDDEFLLELRL